MAGEGPSNGAMKAKLEDALKAANLDVIAVADTDKENLSKNRPRVQKPGKKKPRPVQSSRPATKRPTESQVSASREYDKALKAMVDDTVGPEAPGEALARYENRERALGKDAKIIGKIAERDRKLSNKWEVKQQKYWQNGSPTPEDLSKGMEKAFSRELERNEPLSESDINKRYFGLADMIFAKGYSPNDLKEWKPLSRAFPGAVRDKAWPVNLERRVLAELEKKEPLPPIVLPHEPIAAPVIATAPEEDWDDGSSGPMTRTDIASVNPGVVESIRAPGQHRAEKPRVVTKVEQKARRSYDRALGAMAIDAAEPGETAALDSYKSALRTMTEEATETRAEPDAEVTELDVAPVRHDSTPALPADKFKDLTPKSIRESLRRSILSQPTEMPAGAINTLPPVIGSTPQAAPEPVLTPEVAPDAADAALGRAVFPSVPTEGVANLPAVVNPEATPTWQPLAEQGLTQEELVQRRAERRLQIGVEAGLTQELGDMYNAREAYLTAYRAFYANNNLAARAAVQATNSTEWQNLKRLEAAAAAASLAYQQALERSATERLAVNTPEREALLRAKGEARYLLLVGVGWNAPRYEDGRLMSKEDYVNQYMTQYQGRVLDRYMSTIAWREVTAGNENARIEARVEALGSKQRNVFDRMRSMVQAANQGLERTLTPTGARAFRIVAAAGVGTVLGGWAAGAMRGASVIAGMLTGSTAGAVAGSLFQRLVGARRAAAVDTVRHSRITSAADLAAAAAAFRKGDATQIAATRRRWEMGVALGVAFLTARSMPALEPVVTSSLSDLRRIGGEIMGTSENANATAPASAGGESTPTPTSVTRGAGGTEGQPAPVAGGESSSGGAVPVAGGDASGSAASLDSSVPPPANNPGPAGSPFGRIPVPTDTIPQADAVGGYARESAIIAGGSGGDAVSSEGLDDMRAVTAEVRGTSTEYVARSGDGGIKLVEGLQQQLAREGITETTPGISEMTREIAAADTNAEAEAVAKKYGLYKPGVTDESAAIGKEARIRIDGDKLVLTDAKGEAVFIDEKNPYSGRMFDSNPPPPVREIPPETRASGERVAPSEAPPPAQREVVSSAGQEQIVPKEEPPRTAGQTKSYWDMTEVEKTQHLNRLSIADARQARLDWEDYARKYEAYLEEVARERGVPAAAVVENTPVASAAPIERDLPPVRVDASPTPAPAPAPAVAMPAPEPVRSVPSPEGPPRDTISTDEAIRQFGDPQAAGSRGTTPTPAASESITTDEAINQLRAQKK